MTAVFLNGKETLLSESLTLAELIEQLGYSGKRIAVELNGEIVPKSRHEVTRIDSGDQLEIVVAVGGG